MTPEGPISRTRILNLVFLCAARYIYPCIGICRKALTFRRFATLLVLRALIILVIATELLCYFLGCRVASVAFFLAEPYLRGTFKGSFNLKRTHYNITHQKSPDQGKALDPMFW